jgi:hypothetical protein
VRMTSFTDSSKAPEYANAVPLGTVAGDIVAAPSNGKRSAPG